MQQIKDGTGSGFLARVTNENRLAVFSASASVQLVQSLEKKGAYQLIGESALSSGTTAGIHVENSSATSDMIITYVRFQIVGEAGGTALPNSSNYFQIAAGRSYSSGGTIANPVNVNIGSGNTAGLTCYEGAPVLSGTATPIDKWYPQAGSDMNTFRKEGAVIVPPNRSIELSFVGDQTSGLLYTRVSFLMREVE